MSDKVKQEYVGIPLIVNTSSGIMNTDSGIVNADSGILNSDSGDPEHRFRPS